MIQRFSLLLTVFIESKHSRLALGSGLANLGMAALDESERAVAVKSHNNYRRLIASGEALNKDGSKLSRGNVPSLVNLALTGQQTHSPIQTYDTALEFGAQKWVRQCVFRHSERDGIGENLYVTTANSSAGMSSGKQLVTRSLAELLADAAYSWWNELSHIGIAELRLTEASWKKGIGHWSQMAWGKTKRIGCGVQWCSDMALNGHFGWTFVVCHYSPR